MSYKYFLMKSPILFLIMFMLSATLPSQTVKFSHQTKDNTEIFVLENGMVKQSVVIKNKKLLSDTLQTLAQWAGKFNRPAAMLVSDANFSFSTFYNAWRAPGKDNNADNEVSFDKNNFTFDKYSIAESTGKERQIDLYFKGNNNPFVLIISYKLNPGEFFSRRKLSLKDPQNRGHFLEKISPRKGMFDFAEIDENENNKISIGIEGLDFAYSEEVSLTGGGQKLEIIKEGGFGQPVAFASANGGGFMGLEYPTATSVIKNKGNGLFSADSYQYFGQKIEAAVSVESNWEVTAVTPQPYVKKWFFDYVDKIRVAPAKPYTMYNSWYDLRSTAFTKTKHPVPADAVMNLENTLRIIKLLRENMTEKHGIHLDAFVLDDGWDVYESDWKLNKEEFPTGLKPISDTLAKTGTRLGIWFGPIGGYSFAMKRVKWMGEHGYEVTGNKYKYGSAMLCLAGKNYSNLFRKRITDFTRNDNVGYYKWDGIQFACSEPGHGHPVGIYSRRAVTESIIDKCNAVRAIDPGVYLNITSGTWLSPWWVQYANQIWMDAADYAFSDVPSISRRDNAMTYRDYALYDDFKVRKLWFPVSNMMTHGIIKGRLENISKGGEPFDRFTNNAVLYFARGISMWELYISPDILTQDEWEALSKAISWAKANYDIMATTFMVGGNPAKGETYGYVHFKNKKGIVAVRNPKVESDVIRLYLKPEYGIDEDAANLVVEQIYPYRKILPALYSAGGLLQIELNGFETAIFDVYPMESTNRPLLAGAVFSLKAGNGTLNYKVYETCTQVKFLQPGKIEKMTVDGLKADFKSLKGGYITENGKENYTVSEKDGKKTIFFKISSKNINGQHTGEVALLFGKNEVNDDFPEVTIKQNGKKLKVNKQQIKGKWAWYSAQTGNKGDISVSFDKTAYRGTVELWINDITPRTPFSMTVNTGERINDKPMPPLPYPQSEKRNYRLLKTKTIR